MQEVGAGCGPAGVGSTYKIRGVHDRARYPLEEFRTQLPCCSLTTYSYILQILRQLQGLTDPPNPSDEGIGHGDAICNLGQT